jgi:dTDP-4-dehydrorhamnose reductase
LKIYLTGGTGFIGSNIIRVAQERYQAEVLTTVNTWRPNGQVSYLHELLDIRDLNQVIDSVEAYAPDAIIHSAALLDMKRLQQDRRYAWQVYVDSTRNLIEAANRIGAKIVLVSSDWVFDGTQAPAEESTPPNPVNLYGVLKLVCETLITETAQNGAVARVAGVSGRHWARPDQPLIQNVGFGYFTQAVLTELQNNRPFTVWEGEINMATTPSLASECAEMMLRIIKLDRRGVFHCCGGERATRLELAKMTAEVFELDSDLIRTGPPDAEASASLQWMRVPRDSSLSASYTAKQLDYQLPSVRDWLGRYRSQVETSQVL